jgi:hypothetical protein
MALFMNILTMLFMEAVMYNVAEPDDGERCCCLRDIGILVLSGLCVHTDQGLVKLTPRN